MIGGMSSNEPSEDRDELSLLEGVRRDETLLSSVQQCSTRRSPETNEGASKRITTPDSVTELLLVSGISGAG
jgi:hypothetical protein